MVTLTSVMRANAASCIIFGLIFLAFPSGVAVFLDSEMPAPKTVLLILGAGLVINGGDLIRVSLKPLPSKSQVLYFSIGDFIWAFISIGLVLFDIWITTREGVTATILVAIMVILFGILQMLKRREMGNC